MLNNKPKNLIVLQISLSVVFVLLSVVLVAPKSVLAAEPDIMISWKANNYTPIEYNGKALPIRNSTIDIAFQFIDSSTGKILDVSKRQVRWYINGQIVFRRDGLSHIRIRNDMIEGDDINVRVAVEYNGVGANATGFIEKSVNIRVVAPKVRIIRNVLDGGLFSGLSFKLVPLFFNVDNLKYLDIKWNVNGVDIAEDNQDELLRISSGNNLDIGNLRIGVNVFNILNDLERADYAIEI